MITYCDNVQEYGTVESRMIENLGSRGFLQFGAIIIG